VAVSIALRKERGEKWCTHAGEVAVLSVAHCRASAVDSSSEFDEGHTVICPNRYQATELDTRELICVPKPDLARLSVNGS
jgi:hypothetical protein